jgi:PPM family protein phosphatase
MLATEHGLVEALVPAAGGAAAVWTAPRPGRATASEDALLVLPLGQDSAVLAVADGMGGMPGGGAAAARAIAALAEAVEQAFAAGQSLQAAILDGFGKANASVLRWAMAPPRRSPWRNWRWDRCAPTTSATRK